MSRKFTGRLQSKELMKYQRIESSYKTLNELRKNNKFCDAIIKTANGDHINVQKCVLMSNSVYFEKMFDKKNNENDQNSSYTLDIDSDVLHNLINYIYSGTLIQLNEENVMRTLKGADILQLFDVQEFCIEFLQRTINDENWLDIKAMADSRMIANVSEKCINWARKNFIDICYSDSAQFLKLDIEELKHLINSPELCSIEEDNVYDAVILWIKHDKRNRKHFLPELLTLIKVPLMNNIYVHRILGEEPLITSNRICFEYLSKIHEELFYDQSRIHYHDFEPCSPRYSTVYNLPCIRCYLAENTSDENDSSSDSDSEINP